MDDYEDMFDQMDTEKFWRYICSIVSSNSCDVSSEGRRFSVLSKFHQEKMFSCGLISTFYNRFKQRYEARKVLKVPGF